MRLPHGLPRLVTLLALTGIVTACHPVPRESEPVVLDVPNRADATPWVSASGSFVAVTWGATRDGKSDVFLATSRDGGATFTPPVQVNEVAGEARLGAELPPRVALIETPPGRTPAIAVLWTARGARTGIKMARSEDGGRTFGPVRTLQSPDAEGDRGWPALGVAADGAVHAIWLDHRGLAATRTGHVHGAAKTPANYDGVAMAQQSGLYHASATAERASAEQQVTSGVCYCCKTALVAGPDGALYAAWRHVYPGNLRDMAFAVSRDGGRSFSAPVRVSQDGWAINGCPDDGPALAAGQGGEVHIVWPTVIDGADPEGAIFYASTRDGRPFTPRLRVPASGIKPSHPHIVVGPDGRVFVAWDESVGGQRTPVLAEVTRGADGAGRFGPVTALAPRGAGSSPVIAATGRGLVAVWTAPGDPSRVVVRQMPVP